MYRCSMGVQLRRGVNANAPKFTGVLRWHRDAHSELVRWCVNHGIRADLRSMMGRSRQTCISNFTLLLLKLLTHAAHSAHARVHRCRCRARSPSASLVLCISSRVARFCLLVPRGRKKARADLRGSSVCTWQTESLKRYTGSHSNISHRFFLTSKRLLRTRGASW